MKKEQVTTRVYSIAIDALGKEEHELDLRKSLRKDLGIDSLDSLELIMRVEEEFSINFDEDTAAKIDTLNDLITYIETATDSAKSLNTQ